MSKKVNTGNDTFGLEFAILQPDAWAHASS